MTKEKTVELTLDRDGELDPSPELKKLIIEAQIETALNGNTEMLKWLGKQYLGQSDKADANGFDNKPLPFID
tara:strand:+ start:2592 stop:2807 length:216 start_codon:yes stop_codon:yes gene_type:complete